MSSRELFTPLPAGEDLLTVPFEYIREEYVKVYTRLHVEGLEQVVFVGTPLTAGVDYSWLNGGTIQLTEEADGLTDYLVTRETPLGAIVVQTPGNLSSAKVNLAVKQALHVAEEGQALGEDAAAQSESLLVRSLRVPAGELPDILPNAAGRANQYLVFSPTGEPTVSPGTGSDPALRGELGSVGGTNLIKLPGPGNLLLGHIMDRTFLAERFGVVDDPNFQNPALRVDQAAKLTAMFGYAVQERLSPIFHSPVRAYSSTAQAYNPSALVAQQKLPDIDLSNLVLSILSAGFTLGGTAGAIDSAQIALPNVRRASLSWAGSLTAPDNVGLRLINLRFCNIMKGDVRGYTVGTQHWSENYGYYGNTFAGGLSQDNRVAESLICSGVSSFINDNSWRGGSTALSSSSIALAADFVAALYFGYTNSGYRGSNNNRWKDFTCELTDTSVHASVPEAVPVWMEGAGGYNVMEKWRVEGWDGPVMHVRGDVNGDANAVTGVFNEFNAGLFQNIFSGQGRARVRQVGGAYGNRVTGPEAGGEQRWQSGPLRDLLWSAGGADAPRTSAPYVVREGIDATNRRQTSFSGRARTNINGQQWDNGGPLVQVDTSIHKNFELLIDSQPGNEGRIFVAGYDAAGALLGATSTDAYGTERNIKFPDATATTLYGGGYITGTDGANRIRLTVRDEVKSMMVGPVSGTAALVVGSFAIRALLEFETSAGVASNSGPLVLDPLIDGRPGVRFATANPGTAGEHGFYTRGEEVYNLAAAVGQPKGWMCTTGGALGQAFSTGLTLAVKGQVIIANGNAYRVQTPGVTSGGGTGPSGTDASLTYTDGSVAFRYIGAKAAFTALENL